MIDTLTEPWLDKHALAQHLSCSVRSIEGIVHLGVPHAIMFGRLKFRASEVEAWLASTGQLKRRGTLPTPDQQEAA